MPSVVYHPAAMDGCRYYRLAEPARVIADDKIVERFQHQYWIRRRTIDNTVNSIENLPSEDVVVFQRPLNRKTYETLLCLQAAGKAVVVEVDDDFHALPKDHSTHAGVNGILDNSETHKIWLMKSCQKADLVTVSTPALAKRYAKHGRYMVLPNFISNKLLALTPAAHKRTWLGWSGSTKVHVGDLEITNGEIGKIVNNTKVEFRVIGSGEGVSKQLALSKNPYATGWLTSMERYYQELTQLDIGICPLADITFNKSKSWLKPLEMAACGVVPIMSPSTEYRRLSETGIGYIAETPNDWYKILSELINNPQVRFKKANADREIVAKQFTLEENAYHWLEAWQLALNNSISRRKSMYTKDDGKRQLDIH